jgi:hypothetical protein
VGALLDAPGVGQRLDQVQAAPAGRLLGRPRERRKAEVLVEHADPEDGRVAAADGDLDARSGVEHGIGDQLAGEHQDVVDEMVQPPVGEHVADESARTSHGGRITLQLRTLLRPHVVVPSRR